MRSYLISRDRLVSIKYVEIAEAKPPPPKKRKKRAKQNYYQQGGLGRLAALTLARWAGWSTGQGGRHVECLRMKWNGRGGPEPSARDEGSTWNNYLRGHEVAVTPLLMGGGVCQDRFEEPVRP